MMRFRVLGAGLALVAAGGIAAAAPPGGHGGGHGGGHVGGGHVGGAHIGGFHAAPVAHGGYHVHPGVVHPGYHAGYNHLYGYNHGLYGYNHGYYGGYHRFGYGYPIVIGGLGYRSGYYGYGGYGYGRGPVVITVPVASPYLAASPPVIAAATPTVAPDAGSAAAATGETALQIADVSPGPAMQAGMRAGDVIFAINGTRVQTGDDMRKVVGPAAEVEIEFFKPQDGRTATVKLSPKDGYIGVTVEQIPVEFRK